MSLIEVNYFRTHWTTAEDRSIEGGRPHRLPMMTCPYCGQYRGEPGIVYPWIDIKKIIRSPLEKRLRYGDAIDFTWEEFAHMVQQLRPQLSDWVLPPAAKFGAFTGKIFARPALTDFVMPGAYTLLARRQVADELRDMGYKLEIFEVKLRQQKVAEDMVEIWAPPVALSAARAGIRWCAHCERGSVRAADIVRSGSVPSDTHLFMLKDCPNFLVLSEQLFDDIMARNWLGLHLAAIEAE